MGILLGLTAGLSWGLADYFAAMASRRTGALRVVLGFHLLATAPDGVVEAVELDGDQYVLAVQWELQEEWRVDRRFLEPFAQFVAAASDRR